VHALEDVQDTPPCIRVAVAPVGVGIVCSFHSVPFQLSAKGVYTLALLSYVPTIVQLLADVHETPVAYATFAPVGAGIDWTFHSVPFQISAKGATMAELFSYSPTAMQALAEVHDTASRLPLRVPLGSGVVVTFHSEPFQLSLSENSVPELLSLMPTAMQPVADAQATPYNTTALGSPRYGVVCRVHSVPFHRSTTG
jgi:hypothetical protein